MFVKYVGPDTVDLATFNYHEPSFMIDKGERRFTVFHTRYPQNPQPNLVVIEANEDREELYFRTFPRVNIVENAKLMKRSDNLMKR